MSSMPMAQITLEQAQALVAHLEQGEQQAADDIIESLTAAPDSSELFAEIGKLTRQLHESLKNFSLDSKISDLATEEIPDAKERLNYVINMTEQAANTTMDAVEDSIPIADRLQADLAEILPMWQRLMSRDIKVGEFKSLCQGLDGYLGNVAKDSATLHGKLTEVLMAQGFQDLTGQVIRRVIDLVKEVEDSLIHLLTVFGASQDLSPKAEEPKAEMDASMAEGPIIDTESRDDVVSGQDDVDDLLSSLGF